jgi:hypothetical protein
MNSETIVYCVVALILGMLLANMLKGVCGCKTVVEGAEEGAEEECGVCRAYAQGPIIMKGVRKDWCDMVANQFKPVFTNLGNDKQECAW